MEKKLVICDDKITLGSLLFFGGSLQTNQQINSIKHCGLYLFHKIEILAEKIYIKYMPLYIVYLTEILWFVTVWRNSIWVRFLMIT